MFICMFSGCYYFLFFEYFSDYGATHLYRNYVLSFVAARSSAVLFTYYFSCMLIFSLTLSRILLKFLYVTIKENIQT